MPLAASEAPITPERFLSLATKVCASENPQALLARLQREELPAWFASSPHFFFASVRLCAMAILAVNYPSRSARRGIILGWYPFARGSAAGSTSPEHRFRHLRAALEARSELKQNNRKHTRCRETLSETADFHPAPPFPNARPTVPGRGRRHVQRRPNLRREARSLGPHGLRAHGGVSFWG